MPQMMPMMWMFMLLFMFSLLILISINFFFLSMPLIPPKKLNFLKMLNWLWKW